MSARFLTVLVALLTASQIASHHAALAQLVPVGPEFQVNTYTPSVQYYPSVASGGAGGFVVVWQSIGSTGTDTSDRSIQGQRYDASGTPVGGEFQVNTFTTDAQRNPAVADTGSGSFVVVWDSGGSDEGDVSGSSVHGQRYNASGLPLGSQFQVNTYTTGGQFHPAVASDGAGGFVVVWDSGGSAGSDSWYQSVQGQRYDGSGTPVGDEFQVNTYTSFQQHRPKVTSDGAGGFVVVWSSYGSAGTDTSLHSVQGQRYDASGLPLGGEFQVNTYTTSDQLFAAVGDDGAGGFVVVWHGSGSGTDTSSYGVHGQRYDASGLPLGGEFQVNTYTTSGQGSPAVASDVAGGFVVLWDSNGSAGSDNSSFSVQGQRFALVTTTTTPTSSTSTTSTGVASTTTSSTSSSTSSTLPTTNLLSGRIALIRDQALARFISRPDVPAETFMLPSIDVVVQGGTLRIFDTGATAGDDTYNLPAGSRWRGLGNPLGSKGYKYRGAGDAVDPCKLVLIKEQTIKATCKGSGVTLRPPFTGDIGIVLNLGTTDRYCAQFGGDETRNDATLTKRKNAPAPGSCP